MSIPLPIICVLLGLFLSNAIGFNLWVVLRLGKIEREMVSIKTALDLSFDIAIRNEN